MSKGKLINNVIVPAPSWVDYKNTRYNPAPDNILTLLGYKDIVYETMPTDAPERKHYEEEKTENATQIIVGWKLVDDTPEQICAQLRYWFDNEYREDNEKLTRFAALGITETVEDAIRGKTYTCLADLYAEAEIVRAEIKSLENGVDGE